YNFQNLSNFFFEQSFIKFPATQSNNQTWAKPTLDFSIFDKDNKHKATFQNTTPTNLFHKLSNDTKKEFMKLNNTETKNKHKAYYFYRYFKAYLTAVAKNDEFIHLNKYQAIQKLISTSINTYYLAHAIIYYFIMKQEKFNILKSSNTTN
ncbi:40719_t:CDS:1, partial [Gigaspora margarita]